MTIAVPLRSLQKAVATVSPAVERKTTIPVLGTIRVQQKDAEFLEFTATDLTLYIRVRLAAAGQPGEPLLLPALTLEKFSKLLAGDSVKLSAVDDRRASLTCGKARTRLPILDPKSFPSVGALAGEAALALKPEQFARMLDFTFAVPEDDTKNGGVPGALLEVRDGKLSMVSVDGHRLTRYSVHTDGKLDDVLLSLPMVNALRKLVGDGAAKIELRDGGENVYASFGDSTGSIEIGGRKLVKRFPNYRGVMPSQSAVIVRVNAAEMVGSLRRCVSFAEQRSFAVTLTIHPESIHFQSASEQAGEIDDDVSAASADSFEPFKARFNANYLLDVLTRLDGDVALRFADTSSRQPLWISCSPVEGESFEYVVMPMKI
ncbi:MAG TPA: hypothetical protein VMD97_01890 [Candidatus Aquilonibacter sp.]|nr:hypothetical protein [Candidatus Aquilonibacter sp.]